MRFAAIILFAISTFIVSAEDVKPIKALLVIGGCCHDYKNQQNVLKKGLEERAHIEVTIAYDPDTGVSHKNPVYDNPEWYKNFDVVIHDECCSDVKDSAVIEGVLKPHKDGLPAVLLHCGMHSYRGEGYPKETAWFKLTGLHTNSHDAQAPIAITFADPENPITKGIANWTTINEELYNNLQGKVIETAKPLATGKQIIKKKDGTEKVLEAVVAWTNTYNGKTKVFGTTIGHNTATVADARYLDMVTRGLLWSCDKLNEKYLKKK